MIQLAIYKFRKEEETDTLHYSACGGAISKLIVVAEVLKHRIPGLHQINTLKCIKVKDTYEPKEEDLDTVIVERFITLLEIVLTTKDPEEHDPIGYQPPIPAEEIDENPPKKRKWRRGNRGYNNNRRSGFNNQKNSGSPNKSRPAKKRRQKRPRNRSPE